MNPHDCLKSFNCTLHDTGALQNTVFGLSRENVFFAMSTQEQYYSITPCFLEEVG